MWHLQMLKLFGAELMSETPAGYTALHYAAIYGNLDCLKVIAHSIDEFPHTIT